MATRKKKKHGPIYLIDTKVLAVVLQVLDALTANRSTRGHHNVGETKVYQRGYAVGYQAGIRKNIRAVLGQDKDEDKDKEIDHGKKN